MNQPQELWWNQVRSDLATWVLLRHHGAHPCQQLHYLQMVSEKLGKAYFCKLRQPPIRSHATFVPFLRAIGSLPQNRRHRLANLIRFPSYVGFQTWIQSTLPLAYGLERLAPALAGNGPNLEYPWPQEDPTEYPAAFEYPIWRQLTQTSQGRQFLQTLQTLVDEFPQYA